MPSNPHRAQELGFKRTSWLPEHWGNAEIEVFNKLKNNIDYNRSLNILIIKKNGISKPCKHCIDFLKNKILTAKL